MKRLVWQFVIFALVLGTSFGVLLVRSYREIGREERDLARGYAEQVFDQMQVQLGDLLAGEDRRSFSEFRFFQAVAGERRGESALARSPLSRMPDDDPRGLVGYFQIDPDGTFSTPYLPASAHEASDIPSGEHASRAKRQALLEDLTVSLQERVRSGAARARPGRGAATVLDLGSKSKDLPVDYRAVLKAKKERLDLLEEKALGRGEAPTEEELRYFEEQRRALEVMAQRRPERPEPTRLVSIDPFQARLINQRFVVFYRKLWLEKTLYVQGFVVDAERFFDWLMGRTFGGSPLYRYAVATLGPGRDELFRYGSKSVTVGPGEPLFERALGYPLNVLVWRTRAASYPPLAARGILLVVSALAGLVFAVGLASVYRTAAAEVRLARKRQDLVSAVTHELRAPLTAIRMYSEMLEEGMDTSGEKRLEYCRVINRESARLSRLVESMLQLARLERKTYRVDIQSRVPSADFNEICGELAALAARQGFRLMYSASPDLPALAYDPDAVKQILLALLDNSLKFAAEARDRILEMSLTTEREKIVWAWSDRGPGVPADQLGRIFETFYRVEREATRRTKGTGIGLAIARGLAEAMGARIEACNRKAEDGGGLEVRLVFRAQTASTGHER